MSDGDHALRARKLYLTSKDTVVFTFIAQICTHRFSKLFQFRVVLGVSFFVIFFNQAHKWLFDIFHKDISLVCVEKGNTLVQALNLAEKYILTICVVLY